MNWHEIHALVTGGTRGIGLELVTQLLAKGAKVTATGTTDRSLTEARARLPQVNWVKLDQADTTSREAFTQGLPAQGIRLLIHNAGVQQLRDWTGLDAAVAFDKIGRAHV